MDRENVASSNITSIGYDVSSQILEIEFKDGDVYQYSNVPEYVYSGLMSAGSHGKYLNENVKKVGYTCVKVS